MRWIRNPKGCRNRFDIVETLVSFLIVLVIHFVIVNGVLGEAKQTSGTGRMGTVNTANTQARYVRPERANRDPGNARERSLKFRHVLQSALTTSFNPA